MSFALRTLARRGYATATEVKAPVQLNSLTGTYATSTYLAALKKSSKDLEKLATDIEAFDKRIKEDAKVRSFIQNPTLSAADRQKALGGLVPKSASPILTNLLNVLAENGRLSSATKVFEDFNTLISAYRGELQVIVTSAEALDKKHMDRLEKTLKTTEIAKGKQLKLVNRVNPGILGGVMVDFGDKTIDLSVSSKVNKFNQALAAGV